MSYINSVYGWFVMQFDDPDTDTLSILRFKVCAKDSAPWRSYMKDLDAIDSAIEIAEDQFGELDEERYDGDVLCFYTNQVPLDQRGHVMVYWQHFFREFGLHADDVEVLELDDAGYRPQMTPNDQVRADKFEDLIDSCRQII